MKAGTIKQDEPWMLLGKADAETEAAIFSSAEANNQLIGKYLMPGSTEARSWGHQRMRWLDSNTDAIDMNLGKFQEMLGDREA